MAKQEIGVIGMAVMGRNLALNIESKGYSVSIFNRSRAKTDDVVASYPDKQLLATYSLEEFTQSLAKPRKIILMVKAGAPTDATIESLLPYLEKGDILIDGGNTFFKDTMRRSEELASTGVNFIGTGISGGEDGARLGPSMMPGGQKAAYELVAPILKDIAAKAEDGSPCVTYIGPNGAGHYVKMVHNGIEYGDMQLIAEIYDLLRRGLDLSAQEIGTLFAEWNQAELDSFLMEISAEILQTVDPRSQEPMVDMIKDQAGNKGTGKWTSQSALDLGEPLSLITESVFARFISALKEERIQASQLIPAFQPTESIAKEDRTAFIEDLRHALYFAKIMSYAQGFAQLKTASETYQWDLPFAEIASIWRAGCIIRAGFLQNITDAFQTQPDLQNLMLDPYFLKIVNTHHQAVRRVVSKAVQLGIPVPTLSAAIAYYDSYRTPVLPANLIQAQRDYFGAHTYQRNDLEGTYHFLWKEGKEEKLED
ncbi:NADP-dependent phosphogluconate dehydrogenase [Ignavigranum ruoffiae]|uniref:6-phosphogluconate dehydrogenase, decarboxylating n=1 Tax=Ignavigranum ruoffiae TaxID=89093 RepID=A0A1H8ZPZ8_9LACT|nr:NADP-dependent phosphogluconate dehydrogenase [Ignavigranum ruoffiae]SEP66579.1 6-phosphogluconate dehydrogenase (decarboxylating) [Ignavigranum ruoffiae]